MTRMPTAFSIALCASLLTGARTHVGAQTPSGELPRSYWLIVTGLSGEEGIAGTYRDWSTKIATAAKDRFGATRVVTLTEAAANADSSTMSTKANIEKQLLQMGSETKPDDALFVILIGHGSAADSTARIALPGPDMTPKDLAMVLSGINARVTVVNTASASGAWVAPLAQKGRVVITSTKSGIEQNEATFGGYFAAALTADDADVDKDNRISVLEAFNYAKGQVERAYTADKKMLTEHAQIDGDGDGKAVAQAPVDSPDGAIAGLTFFGVIGGTASTSSATVQSPELRALYAEKARLELQLGQLRAKKTEMADADYQKQLEALLLEIAKNGQNIRKLEGGK